MGKKLDDQVIDGSLNIVKNNAFNLTVCSAEPANFAAIAGLSLATVVTDSNDYVISNGDTSGRKLAIQQQLDIPIDNTGTGNHVALDDNTTLLFVTTATSQVLTSGGTVTVNEFDWEIADPV